MNIQYDVIIIGAGFAGLTAAKSFHDQGINIKVLEARPQVGGRVESTILHSGERIDIGGTWITPLQTQILNLARSYNVETFALSVAGNDLGSVKVQAGSKVLADIISQLDEMADGINTSQPWNAPQAGEWDKQSFGGWFKQNVTDQEVRQFLNDMSGEYFLCNTEKVSLLHALFYWKSNGGFEYIFGESGQSINQMRCDGSAHQLCLRMSEELGDRVLLNCFVRRIVQDKYYATVFTDLGEFTATRVLIAMSPTDTSNIVFEPALNPFRLNLAEHLVKSSLFAFKVVYEEPFWRDIGLSGTGIFYQEGLETADSSPKDNTNGTLSVYSCPHSFRQLVAMTEEERKTTVLDTLAKYYGDAAATPRQYIEKATIFDPVIRGCVTVFPPNTWTTFGAAIREPDGLIHWAGTETATEFAGQMEGAIRSGHRAAEEILSALA